MNILSVIILSAIEGITEFLPISSTGHMVLAARLLQVPQTDFVKSFEIFIQLGAIFAVVLLYFKTFLKNKTVWQRIITAFIPTAIVGFALYKPIKHLLIGNVNVTLASLFLGGVAMIVLELYGKDKNAKIASLDAIPTKNAFMIGLFQSISVIPGVSRAAATIIGAMLTGVNRKTAVEFSFLLAVPTLAAATGLDLVKSSFAFTMQEWSYLLLGLFVAFIVAYMTMKYFLRFIEHHTFISFGVYRIVVAIAYFFLVR